MKELMALPEPPDAFLAVSDHQSLAVLEIAANEKINVPEDLGIFGFANEAFSSIIRPSLSSVDQKSKELGKHAAHIYFDTILNSNGDNTTVAIAEEIIQSEIVIRESSRRMKA